MQKPEYQNALAISQSAIKAFKTKPLQKFKQVYIDKEQDDDEDESKYAFGSLVDTLAFEPSLLDERFYIPEEDVNIPGEKVKVIVDKVFREAKEITDNKVLLNESGNLPVPLEIPDITDIYSWRDVILKAAKEIKYGGTTWSDNRILDTVYIDGSSYMRMLGISNGRQIITARDNADALDMVNALRNSKDTYMYFTEQEEETLLFQQEIFIDYEVDGLKIPLKGALDIIRLNHKEKKVFLPDLKTTYDSDGFRSIVRKFDYVTQVSFYTFLLKEFLKVYKDGKYTDYELQAPINIVIDRDYKVPYIYEYDWEDLEIAREGSTLNNVRGWYPILKDIGWHISNSIWDKPREMYEFGSIKLKLFK